MEMKSSVDGETIERRLERHSGLGPGFDIVRIVLALMIFFMHTRGISGTKGQILNIGSSDTVVQWSFWPFIGALKSHMLGMYVPMFFALSGFLVTGSAIRVRSAGRFLALRCLRIMPALAVEVTLSAIILGPLATKLPLKDYFEEKMFYSYFLNIVGSVHFFLPGVFYKNPTQIVNANLWTLPSEFYCYLIIIFMILAGALNYRLIMTICFLICLAIESTRDMCFGLVPVGSIAPLELIVLYFFSGVILFLWRGLIRLSFVPFIICALLSLIFFQIQGAAFLAVVPLTYVTVFAGCSPYLEVKWLRNHDISYGIYLYGYPICQSVVFFMPSAVGHNMIVFFIGILATITFASISWHLIEKPALRMKKYVSSSKPKRIITVDSQSVIAQAES